MRQKTALGYLFVFALLMSAGCAGLPPIISPDNSCAPEEQSLSHELNALFPADSFQFVHAIELTMPGNHSAMLMGVVNIYPRHRAIHCVVMTLEGLVLFEADHTNEAFIIHRAIPPFDSQALARGLVSDIELIFFRPRGRLDARGMLENKNTILRFSEPDSGTIDIVVSPDRTIWTQNLRTCSHRIKRCVTYIFPQGATNSPAPVFPRSITLTAAFPSRYTLTMTLTDASLITDTFPCGDNK